MDVEGLVEEFIGDNVPPETLSMALPDHFAKAVVDRLKQEAEAEAKERRAKAAPIE